MQDQDHVYKTKTKTSILGQDLGLEDYHTDVGAVINTD